MRKNVYDKLLDWAVTQTNLSKHWRGVDYVDARNQAGDEVLEILYELKDNSSIS